jgi:UDP-N-acetylmuramate dehydrogenase
VVSVETLNRKGEINKRDASEYRYGYRSIKNVADMDAVDEWFVSATLKLKKRQLADLSGDSCDIKQLLAKRAATQPTGAASCGSVFRNPEGGYAAQLIQDCGLKGKRIGGAVVSQKHANFIINDGGASAEDIETLVNYVQSEVKKKFGIYLQHEVRIFGDAKPTTKRRRSLLDE